MVHVNRTTAEAFINFVLRADQSAAITNYTGYSSPNRAAFPLIRRELLEDPGMYPTDEVMQRLEFYGRCRHSHQFIQPYVE